MRARSAGKGLAFAAAGSGLAFGARELLRRERDIDLAGRVVLITGGSRGLGFALAEEFGRQGTRIVICARDADGLETARHDLTAQGVTTLAAPCDVRDQAQVARLVERATAEFGRVDILVNNAGVIEVGPLATQTPHDFHDALATMFWGTLYPTLAVLPQMRARGEGRVVNITSIGGKLSVPHLLPYSSAKFAAVGLSEGLRAELAKDGILVVTVVPGLMRTGSPVNALFKGRHRLEYAWFTLGDSLPFTSIDAGEAARRIVRATRRGDAELTITWQAQLLARVHGLFPGLTAEILSLIDRALPADGHGTQAWRGHESESAVTRSFLTTLGRRAEREYHQVPRAEGTGNGEQGTGVGEVASDSDIAIEQAAARQQAAPE